MPDNKVQWNIIKQRWGDEIPASDRDAFFSWIIDKALPPTAQLPYLTSALLGEAFAGRKQEEQIRSQLKSYYNQWASLPVAQKYPGKVPPTPTQPPEADYEWPTPRDLEQDYLYALKGALAKNLNELARQVEAGETTQEQADEILTQAGIDEIVNSAERIIFSEGLGSRHLTAYPNYFAGELIGNNWKIYLSTFAEENRDYDVFVAPDGHLYTSTGERLPDEAERYTKLRIEQDKEQIEIAREAQRNIIEAGKGESKELKEYFDLQKQWQAPETQAHRSIILGGEPQGRAEYDIIVAKNAAEATNLGYGSYIPEAVWNSPKVQAVVETTLLKNLSTQLQRLGLWRMEKTGTQTVQAQGAEGMVERKDFPVWQKLGIEYTGIAPDLGEIASGRAPGFWDMVAKLSDSERDLAQQLARKAGMEAAGGEQTTGSVLIRNERSPLWHTDKSGERVQGAWRMSSEEWRSSTRRKVKGQIASATAARKRRIREELEQSYREFVGGKMGDGKRWETPTGYVLGGEKTPTWMPQYVPGLTAGEPLRLGHQFPTLSGQQWLAMPPSQKSYLKKYTDISGEVLGDIPQKPWEDVMHQIKVGSSQAGTFRTRWLPKKQRA